MFKNPEIDTSKSIKMIVHVIHVDDEYVPLLELVFPDEESINLEGLFAMREALDFCSKKIEKVIDGIV